MPESRFKVVDVDLDELRQTKGDHIPVTREKRAGSSTGHLETLPGMVQRDTEVVGSGRGLERGPERIDQLLTVDAVGRFERQELDNRRSTLLPPDGLANSLITDGDVEPAQETDFERSRSLQRSPPGNPAACQDLGGQVAARSISPA